MPSPTIRVRKSKIHGTGVFARVPIPRGTRIIEYTGEIITNPEADRRALAKNRSGHTFFFSLNKRHIVDAGVSGNESRFINHSCDPNCKAIIVRGHIYIDALTDIAPGQELTYDYRLFLGRRLLRGERATYACHCGKPRCRGSLLDPRAHPIRKRRPPAA